MPSITVEACTFVLFGDLAPRSLFGVLGGDVHRARQLRHGVAKVDLLLAQVGHADVPSFRRTTSVRPVAFAITGAAAEGTLASIAGAKYPGPHDGRQVGKSGFISSLREVIKKDVIEAVEGGRMALPEAYRLVNGLFQE